ncbi:hypothetical protein, partial [Staphylococcus aureus]
MEKPRTILGMLIVFITVALAASTSSAQVQTETTTSKGTASKSVTVENGQVVYVSGNNLIVKMADGSLRHFNNV